MKPYLMQLVEGDDPLALKRGRVREYLQVRALQALQEAGGFMDWAFLGGTALRFLYHLPRLSEDLDFSVTDPSGDARFEARSTRIRRAFEKEGYVTEIKTNREGPVRWSFLKFPGLYHELGLSPHRDEVLSIKVKVDTRPPPGAGLTVTLVRRHVLLRLLHHDRPTLLAGKLHAFLTRPFTKGRDLYDLVWYLSDRTWPEPNLPFLRSALEQSGWRGPLPTPENWRTLAAERLRTLDWHLVRADVEPFLERSAEVALLTRENVLSILEGRE